ncbi:MAG: TonB-dependent receptor, partial [Methylobacteriaceae bacterium]|nr:TonB-dependent receptor [Methylobacteriaceae bacterium]
MTAILRRRAVLAGASSCALLTFLSAASAQPAPEALPDVVVTAARAPQSVSRAGSAISVIRADEIAAAGSKSLADVLRAAPGLDVYESGGPGGLSNLSLRGSQPGQTLILVDGMRMGDPTTPTGEFDLGVISVTDIERIEVLRGPQSALYGSDAMGGVVN